MLLSMLLVLLLISIWYLGDLGWEQEAQTKELLDYRILFFFNSASGDVLSQKNLNSTLRVLNAVNDVISPRFCYKEEGSSTCQPPWTLMSVFKTFDEVRLKDLIRTKDSVLGLGQFLGIFLGADLDINTGRESWMQGHVRIGGPLPGFHNISHDASAQRALYDSQFRKQGPLGSVPSPGGWIDQIDAIIEREETANVDLKIYYGGQNILNPRVFGYVNQDISYSIGSVILVGLFMWLWIGSFFLTCMGMLIIGLSLALTLPTWKLIGNPTFNTMQVW